MYDDERKILTDRLDKPVIHNQKKIRDKYTNKDANICVVVYATGAARTLDNLLKQLKTQNLSLIHI